MKNKLVLDTSALLAYIHREPGADIVQKLLEFSTMSTVNIAEALSALQRTRTLEEAWPLVAEIIPNIAAFDIEQAKYTAQLLPLVKHKGLSLGDRSCIALGMILHAPIYTADKIWAKLQLDEVEIKLIR